MRYLNQVIIEGMLTKDSDERGFALAVNDGDRADFVEIRWGDCPHDFLIKSDRVRVIGKIRSEFFFGEDGRKEKRMHVTAESVEKM